MTGSEAAATFRWGAAATICSRRSPSAGRRSGERLARVRATEPMLAMLSGSGGTVFGLYRDEPDARQAAGALAPDGPMVAPVLRREASRLRASDGKE